MHVCTTILYTKSQLEHYVGELLNLNFKKEFDVVLLLNLLIFDGNIFLLKFHKKA